MICRPCRERDSYLHRVHKSRIDTTLQHNNHNASHMTPRSTTSHFITSHHQTTSLIEKRERERGREGVTSKLYKPSENGGQRCKSLSREGHNNKKLRQRDVLKDENYGQQHSDAWKIIFANARGATTCSHAFLCLVGPYPWNFRALLARVLIVFSNGSIYGICNLYTIYIYSISYYVIIPGIFWYYFFSM